jgi:transposase-like protein
MKCPICDEENTPATMVWSENDRRFVCEDCWREPEAIYWGA